MLAASKLLNNRFNCCRPYKRLRVFVPSSQILFDGALESVYADTIQSYAAAGIDLIKLSKDAGFGNPYNVSALYLFVNSKPEFLAGAEGPLLGNIIFYKDTYARSADMRLPGDNNTTHVAIVSSVLDGQVYSMSHAANEKEML